MTLAVRAVLVGKVAPLGRRGVASGIFKQPVGDSVLVTRTGLAGDAQGDTGRHGGPEKAVHHYPYEHYALWRREAPGLAALLPREGAFGENLSTEGLTEADVCIGDVYRLGTALVQLSQGRQPCWRLNERFGEPAMARRVQETGRTGWYYRVLEEGRVRAGDRMTLVERPAEGWTLQRIMDVLYRDTLNREVLARLVDMPLLAESWRNLARRRLEQQAVEDWSPRLETPAAARAEP
ncbi:MOSC domain-containing protein [Oceanibacterium hippocampi]|uniref:6-N-hydroxylaminopurine resistance protein n=1 Tax=Oceanibacterium hippocampi TaxID=745714 RepID=A0A1Y5RWJ3_9PROT|nr:MOSC domain-containing protein [Oceanibacterium hippocampi]SLN26905.1 6-N-hydroxylaminopurine resistance protein [Oceanibacterium hippocampi]